MQYVCFDIHHGLASLSIIVTLSVQLSLEMPPKGVDNFFGFGGSKWNKEMAREREGKGRLGGGKGRGG